MRQLRGLRSRVLVGFPDLQIGGIRRSAKGNDKQNKEVSYSRDSSRVSLNSISLNFDGYDSPHSNTCFPVI